MLDRIVLFPGIVCFALVTGGCSSTTVTTRTTTETFGSGDLLMSNTMIAGQSVRGSAIEVTVLGSSGSGGVMMIAGIHGDEPAGVPLVAMLEARIRNDPSLLSAGQLVIIPQANPDGLAARQRTNSRGVDLNRNFPADNFDARGGNGPRPLSEPESRVIHRMIELYRPALIVSIHQPIGCIDYDGPAEDIAQQMSEASGLPVRKLGTRPGSLGAYVGETLGIPIITLELPRNAHRLPDEEMWSQYGEMLMAVIE